MNAMKVAEAIQAQLGSRAFQMMGASNLLAVTDDGLFGLQWKIGRNSKGATHVRVVLEVTDTYRVDTFAVRGLKQKTLSTARMIGVEQLKRTIEEATALYLSL